MFMTLIHITTHFPDHPVHSFFTIHLSMTHHSVQPMTMQFVYAISYLMTLKSQEWRYLCIWEDVSCDCKLLQRLLQLIFPMINVKCVLLKNFLYLLSRRIFRAPRFFNNRMSKWSDIFLDLICRCVACCLSRSFWIGPFSTRINLLILKSSELFYEDLLAVDRPIFTVIKFLTLMVESFRVKIA